MKKAKRIFHHKGLAVSSIALGFAFGAIGAAYAQNAPGHEPMQISIGSQSSSQRLVLPKGKSAIVDLPVEARDVVVSNPQVADAVMRTARRGFILGSALGETNVYFLDAQGHQILSLEVSVARDTSELGSLISRLVPEARVKFDAVGESIILNGEVPNAATSDRVIRIANQYAGSADKIVNMMSIKSGDTVQLQVRIVEMQRTVIKQMGINLSATNLLNNLLPEDWGVNLATANGFTVNGSLLGGATTSANWAKNFIRPNSYTFNSGQAGLLDPSIFTGAGGFSQEIDAATGLIKTTYGPGTVVSGDSAGTTIQALERVGLARTLAEPTLSAISGESAKFLAGGEFPVPISQEGSRISVEFKPFGVGLGFTPVVLSPNRISLKLSTEVSEISTAASFRQPDTIIRDTNGAVTDVIRGLSIPGVSVRRAETTMELPSGRSMVVAGLIQQQTRQAVEGLPGLKDLAIIGNLFKSRDFLNSETELVIIVTPYLVGSTTMDKLQTPADGYNPASDANALLLSRLNRVVRPSSSGTPSRKYNAPIGHVLR